MSQDSDQSAMNTLALALQPTLPLPFRAHCRTPDLVGLQGVPKRDERLKEQTLAPLVYI